MNTQNVESNETVDEFLGVPPPARLSRLKKWLWVAIACILLILLGSKLFVADNTGPRYATVELRRGDMLVHVTATGNLEPTNEVEVGSELSGIIDEVYVDINDTVKKGQALAQIDTERLIDAIRRSEAALAQANASVLQAEATLELNKSSLARLNEIHRLSDGKVPSQAELDTARAELKRGEANLAAATASVLSAQAQLSTDKTNLEKATIRSPVNGVILSREVEPGQTLAASFNTPQLFVIAEDLAAMKLEVNVDEADVGQVAAGQPTTFTVDAYPGKVFDAVITRVNVGASTGADVTSASASSVISYGAILSVKNDDLALRPGMTATASILASHETDVPMVPNAALRFSPAAGEPTEKGFSLFGRPPGGSGEKQEVEIGRGASHTIYVLEKDGGLRDIPVRVGNSDGSWTIVTGDGLEPGMQVVTGELAATP